MSYKPTIGLEIHAELKTKTKMFCGCVNNPDEKGVNVNICPVCMGHPGTLPVMNKEAIRYVLKTGVALKGKIADFTEWDRKNYFYPDIPKGYQISQYKYPLISGGELNGIKITRIHLEEDTGTLIHADMETQMNADEDFPSASISGSNQRESASWVNYNRAGVPLMELVTEPEIKNAKEAGDFARELQLILRYLGVSDANMEKGEMRVEVNISVTKSTEILTSAEERRTNADQRGSSKNSFQRLSASSLCQSAVPLGTKVEVKNLNSFKSVERAIDYEIKRQADLIETGGKVTQETRGWDDGKQKTFSQRQKEESHDYRYFPEPDLPKLKLSDLDWASEKSIRAELGELPEEKRSRYIKNFGIKKEDAEMYVTDFSLGKFFEEVVKALIHADIKDADARRYLQSENGKKLIILASNYITSDLAGALKVGKTLEKLNSKSFAELIEMISKGELNSRGAKDTLAKLIDEGGDSKVVAGALGVVQTNDEEVIKTAVEKVIRENSKVVADYKGGKMPALQFLIGQVMKETKGSAKPDIIKELLVKVIG